MWCAQITYNVDNKLVGSRFLTAHDRVNVEIYCDRVLFLLSGHSDYEYSIFHMTFKVYINNNNCLLTSTIL